jgi:ABC-type branched-subunit amino acid transport system substrate-binding protein
VTRRSPLLALLALGALGAALAPGCSLVLDFGDECEADGDCGGGLRCVQGLCVGGTLSPNDLIKPPCLSVYGVSLEDALSPDTILVGTVLPHTGDLAAYGPGMDAGVALAVKEINLAGGLFGKKFGVVSCDSGTDTERAVAAVSYLTDVVGVPAVIGPAGSTIAIEAFNRAAGPSGALMISPAATSPALTSMVDGDRLWRTAPSDAIQGAAIAALLLDRGYAKVAVVNRADAYGNGLRDAIQDGLCQSFACNDDAVYYTRNYAADATYADDQSDIILDLVTFQPEATVLIAFAEDGISFMNLAAGQGIKRFVLSDGVKTDTVLTSLADPQVLCGILGTNPASPTGSNYLSFELRFKGEFGSSPGAYAANSYDAMYLLGYAVAAAGVVNLTGDSLAAGMRRLSAGDRVQPGSSAWSNVIQLLFGSPDRTVNYDGASGALDFDVHGEAPSDIEGWVFDVDGGKVSSLGVLMTQQGVYQAPTVVNPVWPGVGATCRALGR